MEKVVESSFVGAFSVFLAFRVFQKKSKTTIAYFFSKTDRDCVPFLHFYHTKIVNIDILLLWRSVSCTKAFNVTKIHIRILVNRFVQSYYTQRDRLFLITPVLKLIMSTIYKSEAHQIQAHS
jgi:hypothetical protein